MYVIRQFFLTTLFLIFIFDTFYLLHAILLDEVFSILRAKSNKCIVLNYNMHRGVWIVLGFGSFER